MFIVWEQAYDFMCCFSNLRRIPPGTASNDFMCCFSNLRRIPPGTADHTQHMGFLMPHAQ